MPTLPSLYLYHKKLHLGLFGCCCFFWEGGLGDVVRGTVLDSCNIPIKMENLSKQVWVGLFVFVFLLLAI